MNTWIDWGKAMGLVQWALGSIAPLLTNSFQWVLTAVSIVLVIVVCIFAALVVLRKKSPHSGKKDGIQAQMNKKVHSGSNPSSDTVQAGTNGKNLLDRAKETLGLSAKVFWNLAFVIAGIVLWYAIPNTEIRPKDVGDFGQKYWIQTLIVWIIGAGLIWLNDADEKTKKTLQKVLAGGVIMFLAVFPMWSWISSPSPSTTGKSNTTLSLNIPDAGEDQSKWPEPFWPKIELPKGEKSALLPVKVGKRLVMWGEKEFGVDCVYRDGHRISFGKGEQPCPNGDMPWNSVTNKADGPNTIYFAYRPI